jgi:hypothetical protein
MNYRRLVVPVTTDASGNAQAFTPSFSGEIVSVQYVADGTSPFVNTVDFTITLEATGQGLWTESNIAAAKTVAPTQPVHDQVGAAALFAAGGTALRRSIVAADDRVSIALAQGGNATKGSFTVTVA